MSHQESSLFQNVKSVLVVLSSQSMAFDLSALRNFITHSYPGSAVFFISTSGDPVGVSGPNQVDLIIDFTRPGSRQGMFFASKMRRRGNYVTGRVTSGIFGRKRYDRLYDEAKDASLPKDYMERERVIQRKVLEMSGIEIVKQGGVTVDHGKDIALSLPPMQNR
jgi:hypothetical protein